MRTGPEISTLFQPLEDIIRSKLIPALSEGRFVTENERKLLSLPPKLGGMGPIDPTCISDLEYELSKISTAKLTEAIKRQLLTLPTDFEKETKADKQKANK